MDLIVLALFCASLLICILFDASILYALIAGFFIFTTYGLYKNIPLKELLCEAAKSVKTVKNILITFIYFVIISSIEKRREEA